MVLSACSYRTGAHRSISVQLRFYFYSEMESCRCPQLVAVLVVRTWTCKPQLTFSVCLKINSSQMKPTQNGYIDLNSTDLRLHLGISSDYSPSSMSSVKLFRTTTNGPLFACKATLTPRRPNRSNFVFLSGDFFTSLLISPPGSRDYLVHLTDLKR